MPQNLLTGVVGDDGGVAASNVFEEIPEYPWGKSQQISFFATVLSS
jgi:hypothetical protein